ncbi:hypothetical protein XGA_5011 [Xanthomonas hortorum ATCC 19865]|nr:hypothetical protein XGA_5011 [Xanthomonas hortorum ATCC 19865]
MPRTASSGVVRQGCAISSSAEAKSGPSDSSGLMSLKTMPGLGKSAISRIRSAQWLGPEELVPAQRVQSVMVAMASRPVGTTLF